MGGFSYGGFGKKRVRPNVFSFTLTGLGITYRAACFGAVVLLLALCPAAKAADVRLEVSVDRQEITVGDAVAYAITLTWNPEAQPSDPVLEENLGALVVRDRDRGKTETLPDGRNRRTDTYSITSYQVGEYKIPPPLVRFSDKDGESHVAAAEPVSLKVRSIAPEDATEIRDIKPPRKVPRNLTRPLLVSAGFLAGLIALAAIIVTLIRRSRRKGFEEPAEPPFDRAIRRLSALARTSASDHEEMKVFYVELSSILRDYLFGRFDVPAPFLTTSQLRRWLEEDDVPDSPDADEEFFDVLHTADFVKFAKFDPDGETVEKNVAAIRRFLMATKPVETGDAADAEGEAT